MDENKEYRGLKAISAFMGCSVKKVRELKDRKINPLPIKKVGRECRMTTRMYFTWLEGC